MFYREQVGFRKKSLEQPQVLTHRPAIYPHAPRHHKNFLDNFLTKRDFDPLKSHQFDGIIHLGIIMLLMMIGHYIYTSVQANGYLFVKDGGMLMCILRDQVYYELCLVVELVLSLATFGLYKLFLNGLIKKRTLYTLHFLYLAIFAVLMLWIKHSLNPFFLLVSVNLTDVRMMKMHSYVAVNLELHCDSKEAQSVAIKDYVFFLFTATSSVYETNFQRSKQISLRNVLWLAIKFLFCALGMITLVNQFILPPLLHSERDSLCSLLNDMLSLCIPAFLMWLLASYSYFHCWLGLKTEVGMLEKKEFYKDWWNAESIFTFWERWNLPARQWSLKHLYNNSRISEGSPRESGIVFSSITKLLGSELNLLVTFRTFHPFFFFIVLTQIPLLALNRKLKHYKRVGNLFMWLCLMLGEPMLHMLYFRNWLFDTRSSFWCR